ncbi:hypothetical protein Daus18300_001761 [Diaporthe australafricana]|uniref:Uncharacterized protein n=1 Tax=Diaporthe australafricana TaxID=127596 RepID=A0ABR3XT47_9PEZI
MSGEYDRTNQFERDEQYSSDQRHRRSGSQSSTESRGSQCSLTANDEFDDLLQNISDQLTKHVNLLHDYTFTRFLTKSRAARYKVEAKLRIELHEMTTELSKHKALDFADKKRKPNRKEWTAAYKECRDSCFPILHSIRLDIITDLEFMHNPDVPTEAQLAHVHQKFDEYRLESAMKKRLHDAPASDDDLGNQSGAVETSETPLLPRPLALDRSQHQSGLKQANGPWALP